MAKYFKAPDNPSSISAEFYVRSKRIRTDEYGDRVYPTAEVSLRRGGYEYGRYGNTDSETLIHNVYAKPGDQLKMFQVHPSTIEGAFADHSMRSYTPTLLGMAINEAKNIGTGLTYSSDLSEHSSKLAKKGMETGVVSVNPGNPNASRKNAIGFEGAGAFSHEYTPSWFKDLDPISDDEVKAGRETIRGIVQEHRQTKKKHMGPQFKHPDLDKTWYQPELEP